MLPFKKILCPTDFSEPSYQAIKVASELALHFGSELCVLHVVAPVPILPLGPEPSGFNISMYEQELDSFSRKSLETIVQQLESEDLKARLIVLRGNAAEEIVKTAEEEKVDLIVIATRGRTGLNRLFFGSVAEKVVRLATCPALTVNIHPVQEEGEEEKSAASEDGTSAPEEKPENRQAYYEKMESQLKEWGVTIDQLKEKAEKSKTDVKAIYEKQIEELKTKQEALSKTLRDLQESGDEAWDDFKKGAESAFGEMKKALKQAVSRFKKE